MDPERVLAATAAWVDAWLHGNARPEVVVGALRRLAARHSDDQAAIAAIAWACRVVATTPHGSVDPPLDIY